MNDIILYHGSRGGLEGPIQPASRPRCDFGRGFYMGTNPEQVQALVSNDSYPVFYTLKLRLSEIPEKRIYVPNEKEWLQLILSCRKQVPAYSKLPIAEETLQKIQNYDIVVGPISDDRMKYAMTAFGTGALTDEGLLACLQYVDYGTQYVALTEYACSKIDIISERVLDDAEVTAIQAFANEKKEEGKDIVKKMIRQYRGQGLYLDEIIERESQNFLGGMIR